MLKEERFEIILKKLESETNVTYQGFTSVLDVSEDTIRRDIDFLHRNGLLTKVRGGALIKSRDPLSFIERENVSTKEKNIIALKAQQFIKNGMTIFMDGGTTICAIVNNLASDVNIRIVTNNPNLIPMVAKYSNIELILLGGKYYKDPAITAGADTCIEVNNYIADLYFLGTCAINHQDGATAIYKEDAEVKRTMVKSAKKVIVLADDNKLRLRETFKACHMENIDTIITNLPSNDEQLNEFRGLDIQIV